MEYRNNMAWAFIPGASSGHPLPPPPSRRPLGGICEHGRQTNHCTVCEVRMVCRHGRTREQCAPCGGYEEAQCEQLGSSAIGYGQRRYSAHGTSAYPAVMYPAPNLIPVMYQQQSRFSTVPVATTPLGPTSSSYRPDEYPRYGRFRPS
jgi:hypothetical protein